MIIGKKFLFLIVFLALVFLAVMPVKADDDIFSYLKNLFYASSQFSSRASIFNFWRIIFPQFTYCGDGTCGGGENAQNCPQDCGGPGAAYCGNDVCDPGEAGWCSDCPGTSYCGDGICNPGEEGWCSDCGFMCNDQQCNWECRSYGSNFMGMCYNNKCTCFDTGPSPSPSPSPTRTTTTTAAPPQPQCTTGNYRCVGKNLERCTNGQWKFEDSCEHECLNDHCTQQTTTTTTTRTTTTTTTTAIPPQPFGIKCEYKDKKYECSISGTCNSGNWLLNNKEGTPLETPLLFPIPGKAVFETVAAGKVDVTANCYNPLNAETLYLPVNKTKATVTGKFEQKSFECVKITNGYKCTLSYFNGLGENATIMFYASDQTEFVMYNAGPYTVDQDFGNVSMIFICSAFMPGNYSISWNAYKGSDSKFLNPIAWSKFEENLKITC